MVDKSPASQVSAPMALMRTHYFEIRMSHVCIATTLTKAVSQARKPKRQISGVRRTNDAVRIGYREALVWSV